MSQHGTQDTPCCYTSLFQRDWWLDAVAPGAWQALEVREDERLVARMPIVIREKYGQRFIDTPQLTHALGPWVDTPDCTEPKRIAKQQEWIAALVDQIPPFDYYCQPWHYSMQTWLPFHWKNFTSSSRFTYILPDLSDLDLIWSNYRTRVRGTIRKAQKQVTVRDDLGTDELYRLTSMSFGRWNRNAPYSYEFLDRVVRACQAQNAAKMFFAVDGQDRVHAALLLVWDELSAQYLVSGADPELRSSGAVSLLMHEAIAHASTVSNVFDFEGSMVEPIEFFVRGFGGVPRPYLTIRGYSRRMKLVHGFREMFGRAAG